MNTKRLARRYDRLVASGREPLWAVTRHAPPPKAEETP
jgi:hypothetical protein